MSSGVGHSCFVVMSLQLLALVLSPHLGLVMGWRPLHLEFRGVARVLGNRDGSGWKGRGRRPSLGIIAELKSA